MSLLGPLEVRRFLLLHFAAAISAAGLTSDQLTESFDLLKAGIVDSLGVLEMINAVEQHFSVTVDFESMEAEELTVLGPFSRFVAEHAVKPRAM